MHLEHFSEPVLAHPLWIKRVFKSIWCALIIVGIALLIGVSGYHLLGGLPWIDAILEASMILGGMGAVAPMKTDAVKLFASAYALFSGLVVLSTMGIILGPWLHRMMHHAYADITDTKEKPAKAKKAK